MINFRRVLDKSKHYYVAVSGGVDSISAAYLLHIKGFNITLFHFNHKISEQNEYMESFVTQFAEHLDIPLIIKHREEDLINGSLEEACRKVRFKAYSELDSDIVVCHHLDDCVESYLMNCFRGHPQYIPIPINTIINENVSIYRPFMLTNKEDFISFIDRYNLQSYIFEDETNSDASVCRRNWIRNTIIPEINKEISLKKVVRKIMIKWYEEYMSQNQFAVQR